MAAKAEKAGKAAKTAKGANPPAAHSPGSLIWLQGLLCGAVVTLATPSALLAAALLAPAVLAYRLDRQPGRPIARAILVCALAGMVHPLRALWAGGHSMPLALAMLGNAWTWLPAWAAAGGGWLLAELAPLGLRAVLELLAVTRAAQLRAQRARLETEWGIPPAATMDE